MSASLRQACATGCGGAADEPWERLASLRAERLASPLGHVAELGEGAACQTGSVLSQALTRQGNDFPAPPFHLQTAGTQADSIASGGNMLRPGGLALTARVLMACAFRPGSLVLDAGCGAGDSLAFMRGMGLVPLGIDRSTNQLARCRARPELPVLQGQAQQLPLCDECLDGILSECVLSLLPDPGQALGEWHRVLRPGGMLALSDLYALDHRKPIALRSEHTVTEIRGSRGPLPPGGWGSGRSEPLGQAKPFPILTQDSTPVPTSCLDGALPLQGVLELVRVAGFEPLLVEDHTPLLKRFAAELVFAGIPLETFLGRTGDARSDQGCRCNHGSRDQRPRAGYYLLVARKMESRHG